MSALAKASGALKSVDYEVFGRVQGVCFRMYTEDEARKMGVVGWVKNTRQGTVTGQVQGPEDKVNAINTEILQFKYATYRQRARGRKEGLAE
ncbi:acylphosphatase-2 isoform X4 [Chelonia mydas]|uniref:acylphosphatase-2 isoform X4 n=1 Tax=Chelonia mydas TaxID=8469 RepID=UPI0018A20CD4|nr:acylphosphatase-2 isoform X4 [Chelonia mydas]